VKKLSRIDALQVGARPRSLDRLFDAAKKDTVIRLRWPLLILSSYLLYYSPSELLTATQVQAVLILYLLSHTTLYFLSDELFDSPYFYGPLLIFDTIVLGAVLSTTGAASSDFYVACLLTAVLSVICNDARGLLMVTILAPLVYGYFVFTRAVPVDPSMYLRLPFPFVISLFYGYFAQVERLRRSGRDKEEQIKRQQRTAEEIRRQRERLEVLHEVNVSVASTADKAQILASFLETALIHLPYAAGLVRLKNGGALETVAARGFRSKTLSDASDLLNFTDRVVKEPTLLKIQNVFTDRQVRNPGFFEEEGLVSLLGVPLRANNDILGCLLFLTREEHDFNPEEIEFISTLAGQAAIALQRSELFTRSQRQAEELTDAHKIKDEFLKVVSTQLKTPLNVITGYSEMFLEGLLGVMTPIQEKAVETIARQSKELHALINAVLQVSSMEAEPLRAEPREINLWEFFSELRAFYDYPLAKELKLVWNYPGDLPSIEGDRAKLRRVLENLIGNALKFTEHGMVSVTARYLAGKQRLEIRVSDSGPGIAEDDIAKIFDKFRQGRAHAGMEHGGVGLGLYIVKKYLELLGGSIEVQSRPGEGAAFIVEVPAPIHSPAAAHEQLLLPTAGEGFGAESRG